MGHWGVQFPANQLRRLFASLSAAQGSKEATSLMSAPVLDIFSFSFI